MEYLGTKSPCKQSTLATLIATVAPNVVCLLETTMEDEVVKAFAENSEFTGYEYVPTEGQSGPILVLFNIGFMEAHFLSKSNQHMHITFTVNSFDLLHFT